MPYSGPGKYPYWMTIGYGGTASPRAVSELVPVIADGTTQYQLVLLAAMSAGSWSAGASGLLTFYAANGTVTGSSGTATHGSLGTTAATWSTTAMTAPSGSVSVQATVTLNGSPSATSLLNVYAARVTQVNNTAMAFVLNRNSAFTQGYAPWSAASAAVLGSAATTLLASDGNYDSLLVADTIELMGGPGGTPSAIPELADPASGLSAIYRISAPGGVISLTMGGFGATIGPYDLGEPQPTTDVVESLLLDGEHPFGYRASNRTVSIPVLIFAPTLATLAAAREYLLSQIDQQSWTITWTPASTGLPMVLDCFRASPSVVTYGFNYNREGDIGSGPSGWALSLVTISASALPYGRSGLDGTVQVDFANTLADGTAPLAPVTLDSFGPSLANVDTGDGWQLSTSEYQLGPTSAYRWQPFLTLPWPAATYRRAGLAADLTGLPVLSVWLGQSSDVSWPKDPRWVSNVTLAWTLTDNHGATLSFRSGALRCAWGAAQYKPAWTRISASIPQGRQGFNYASVTGYSVRISNTTSGGQPGLVRVHVWLDTLIASPLSVQQSASSPRGSLYTVYGLPGTARAPVSAQVQLPASSPVTQEITQGSTWTVPAGVTQVAAEAWGGGGAGASLSVGAGTWGGGGGGGGEYAAESGVTVVPGSHVPVAIGAGGSPAFPAPLTVAFATAGTHKWTCPAGVTSAKVECWGAGGAGTAGGGGGGGGAYTASSSVTLVPGNVYTVVVGAGGKPSTGKTTADNDARNGASTAFYGGATATGTPVVAAQGGLSPTVGSSHGGDSGKGAATWWGGVGGASPGSAGGGGGAAGSSAGRGAYGHSGSAIGWFGGLNRGGPGGGGGAGASGGGSGGAGANAPGVPSAGSVPGGGGGGGYTHGSNYQGAAGGGGQVVITHTPAAINGGATTFGTSSTAAPVVTAHGGATAATNARNGAAGGSGSSSTVHYPGGTGGLPSADPLCRYLFRSNGSVMTTLGSGSVTAAGFTSAPFGGATQSTGVVMAFLVTAAQLSAPVVTDSAGNDYGCVSPSGWPIAGGGGRVYAFYTQVTRQVAAGTTLTLATPTATTLGWLWYACPYIAALEDSAAMPSGSGTGTSASVTFPAYIPGTYPSGPCQLQVALFANAAGATMTRPMPAVSGTTSVASGSLELTACAVGVAAGLPQAWSSTLGASAGWAAVALPFACATQESLVTQLAYTATTSPSTTTVLPMASAPVFEAGPANCVVVVVQAAATSTITVTDTWATTFSQYASVQAGAASFLHVLAGFPVSAYTTATSVTVTDSASQARQAAAYLVFGCSSAFGTSATATGTSSAPSVTPATGDSDSSIVLAVFGTDASGATVTADPAAPAFSLRSQSSGSMMMAPYAVKAARSTDPGATSATLSASVAWGAAAVRLRVASPAASGGGSAGGAGGPGQPAPPGTGGAGFTGGGKGASGPISTSAGTQGAPPGGGGSGAKTTGATSGLQGGGGGGGMVRLTWQPPLRTLNDFVLHRPSDGAPQALSPLVAIPPSDPPDNREYAVPSLFPNVSAAFAGTYSVLLVAHSWDSPGTSRRVSLTVTQYEYASGPAISVQATRTLTPNIHSVNGYLTMGEVTLPVKAYDPSNTQAHYSVSLHDTNQADSFMDVLFLDSQGTTVLCNIAPGSAGDGQYSNYYVDAPSPDRDLGLIAGTAQGREHAVSVLDMSFFTGGPVYVTGGDNTLLAYSTSGAPYLGLTYSPRWFTDRTQ